MSVGWWHPNVKDGRVHDHPERPNGAWSEAMHRLCEPLYRAGQEVVDPDDADLEHRMVEAKLAGQRLFDEDGDAYYQFRSNEQAATIAAGVARRYFRPNLSDDSKGAS